MKRRRRRRTRKRKTAKGMMSENEEGRSGKEADDYVDTRSAFDGTREFETVPRVIEVMRNLVHMG